MKCKFNQKEYEGNKYLEGCNHQGHYDFIATVQEFIKHCLTCTELKWCEEKTKHVKYFDTNQNNNG